MAGHTVNLDKIAKLMPDVPQKIINSMDVLLGHARIRKFSKKDSIFHTGDVSTSLYFIIDGSVAVSIKDLDREIIVTYLNAGVFFGEMGLFEDSPVRSATVQARTDCELAEISYEKFNELCRLYPELSFPIITQLAMRLKNTTRKVTDLAFLDVTGRVARCLLELATHPETVSLEDGKQIKITHQELAKLVGCSREMIGRVTKSLEEQHFITTKGKLILIHENGTF